MDNPFQIIDERLTELQVELIAIREGISYLLDNSKIKDGSGTASRKEASKYLGISVSTIIRLEKSGALKAIEIGGSIRFDWNHLDEYLTLNTK